MCVGKLKKNKMILKKDQKTEEGLCRDQGRNLAISEGGGAKF